MGRFFGILAPWVAVYLPEQVIFLPARCLPAGTGQFLPAQGKFLPVSLGQFLPVNPGQI
jgi:hypothetical protein